MVTSLIKQILTDAGCTLVIYEQDKLANLQTDQSVPTDTIGVIFQSNSVTLEVKANAIHEHYNPLTIEILQQCDLEAPADDNEVKLQHCLDICKQVINRVINTALFKTQAPYTVNKVLETKYDANVIGWQLNLNLWYLLNENRNPCL
jgi:hypothetical protein